MESTSGLTVEQEFSLRLFQEQIKSLSVEETHDYLLEVLRQSMLKENLYKQMMKNSL